ncbi:MAG: putative sugar nucleotidyl transferase, partial [Nitrososphaeria archaeon]
FEGRDAERLFPLTMTRATYELRCGNITLLEKIQRRYPHLDTCYFVRDHLAEVVSSRVGANAVNDMSVLQTDDFTFVNGKWMDRETKPPESKEEVRTHRGEVLFVRAKRDTIRRNMAETLDRLLDNLSEEIGAMEVDATVLSYPWDLVAQNSRAIQEDFALAKGRTPRARIPVKIEVEGDPEDIMIADTAEVHPPTVLDATRGPIIIEDRVKIYPFTRIEGPSSLGRDTQVFEGKIREGTSIGPNCRIGAEIEESIIHGHSNMRHTGFLGHSYMGEWVNLGALTTNSDLKNDYTNVQVPVQGKLIDTAEMKVGCFLGDHVKTGIGVLLSTGVVAGVMSNILSTGEYLPKYIPPFCWYFAGRLSRGLGITRMIDTAEKVMARRNVMMTREEKNLYLKLHSMTRGEREKMIKRHRKKAATDRKR